MPHTAPFPWIIVVMSGWAVFSSMAFRLFFKMGWTYFCC